MGVEYSCYYISLFLPNRLFFLRVHMRPALEPLEIMILRGAQGVRVLKGDLGVRVPRAQARRVATPSELINLNQRVRIPWTVPIT